MSGSAAVFPPFAGPRFSLLALTASLTLLGLGCGGDGGTDIPAPGGIEVTVVTTGAEPDPDGYTVRVDGGASDPIGINASRYYEAIEPGQHTVQLDGLAANCTVAGENPRTVAVGAGEEAPVEFQVTCSATTGTIRITITTSGPSPDPDGYTIALDGTDDGAIGVSGTVTLPALAPGTHQVGLSGIAGNCTVTGDNPTAVTIVAGEEAQVSFAITCTTPPPGTGTLKVTTATTGTDRDPNGYILALDGGTGQPIGRTATVTLTSVSAGAHTVALGDVAANCTVAGNNPRSVTVAGGATVEVSFGITCAATTGTLQVTAATTGADLDPDGYRVRVDDGTGQAIGIAGTLAIPKLAPGEHNVRLVNVAANCTVAGDNPRSVAVTAGATTQVSFAVSCAATTGSLAITTTTAGSGTDPDGYTVSVDAGTVQTIGINDTVTMSSLAAGPHTVRLANLASGCTVQGDDPRTVIVVPGDTVTAEFSIGCTRPQGTKIAYLSFRDGYRLMTMNLDGSGQEELAQVGLLDWMAPSWSPDGRKIAFARREFGGQSDLMLIDADGSGLTNLASQVGVSVRLSWSPDGGKIASSAYREGHYEIFSTNPDGSGRTSLVTGGYAPMWSPDGTRIAFVSVTSGDLPVRGRIAVMNADGTHQLALTNPGVGEGDQDPRWSPDGSKIAFVRTNDEDEDGFRLENLWVMNSDGSTPGRVTSFSRGSPVGSIGGYDWSPDGTKLAFGWTEGRWSGGVRVIGSNGTGALDLFLGTDARGSDPTWSPDGARILLAVGRVDPESEQGAQIGPNDIFVVNADGSTPVNLTNDPSEQWGGRWQP